MSSAKDELDRFDAEMERHRAWRSGQASNAPEGGGKYFSDARSQLTVVLQFLPARVRDHVTAELDQSIAKMVGKTASVVRAYLVESAIREAQQTLVELQASLKSPNT